MTHNSQDYFKNIKTQHNQKNFRCHTSYVTNYDSQQEEECEENFKKVKMENNLNWDCSQEKFQKANYNL